MAAGRNKRRGREEGAARHEDRGAARGAAQLLGRHRVERVAVDRQPRLAREAGDDGRKLSPARSVVGPVGGAARVYREGGRARGDQAPAALEGRLRALDAQADLAREQHTGRQEGAQRRDDPLGALAVRKERGAAPAGARALLRAPAERRAAHVHVELHDAIASRVGRVEELTRGRQGALGVGRAQLHHQPAALGLARAEDDLAGRPAPVCRPEPRVDRARRRGDLRVYELLRVDERRAALQGEEPQRQCAEAHHRCERGGGGGGGLGHRCERGGDLGHWCERGGSRQRRATATPASPAQRHVQGGPADSSGRNSPQRGAAPP